MRRLGKEDGVKENNFGKKKISGQKVKKKKRVRRRKKGFWGGEIAPAWGGMEKKPWGVVEKGCREGSTNFC